MYKLNEEKMFYDMAEGQAIVINFTSGVYYGTSLLGSAVLDALLAGASVEAVVSALKELPGCPEDIAASVDTFIQALLEKEILIAAEAAGAGCAIDAAMAAEGFALTVDEFSEVQDLILADPVHDVDVEQGWPILEQ